MKLPKINLNEISNSDLNEKEMCVLLGGGEPGCCQCSCAGSATTGTNNSYNNKEGLTSDPGAQTCVCASMCDWEPWEPTTVPPFD